MSPLPAQRLVLPEPNTRAVAPVTFTGDPHGFEHPEAAHEDLMEPRMSPIIGKQLTIAQLYGSMRSQAAPQHARLPSTNKFSGDDQTGPMGAIASIYPPQAPAPQALGRGPIKSADRQILLLARSLGRQAARRHIARGRSIFEVGLALAVAALVLAAAMYVRSHIWGLS